MKADSYNKKTDIYLKKLRRYFHQNTTLPDEVIDAVLSVSKMRKFKKGEFFSKQGEFSDTSAYVCSGIFSVFSTQEDGALFVVTFLKEGDFVQGAFEISEPGALSLQALCDCVVVEAHRKVLQDIYRQYPQFVNFARQMVEKYLLVYTAHMIQIGTQKALDNYLLFQKSFKNYENVIPQNLIASYLGITPTQLSRVKRKLSGTQQAQ